MSQETVAARDMLTRFTQWQERTPESIAADTTYGNGEFLQWLADRSITPHMRTLTVSTEREAHSLAPSVSRTNRKTIGLVRSVHSRLSDDNAIRLFFFFISPKVQPESSADDGRKP